jgi:hypothetical protein
VRDLYKHQFEFFSHWYWVVVYMLFPSVFAVHGMLGWKKLVPASAMQIPKKQQKVVTVIAQVFIGFLWLLYVSLPIYCYRNPMLKGSAGEV